MKRRIGIWLVALTVMLTACGNGSDPGNATVPGAAKETGTQVQDAEIPADVWVMEEAPAIRKPGRKMKVIIRAIFHGFTLRRSRVRWR